jgi:hypothetical protein
VGASAPASYLPSKRVSRVAVPSRVMAPKPSATRLSPRAKLRRRSMTPLPSGAPKSGGCRLHEAVLGHQRQIMRGSMLVQFSPRTAAKEAFLRTRLIPSCQTSLMNSFASR